MKTDTLTLTNKEIFKRSMEAAGLEPYVGATDDQVKVHKDFRVKALMERDFLPYEEAVKESDAIYTKYHDTWTHGKLKNIE